MNAHTVCLSPLISYCIYFSPSIIIKFNIQSKLACIVMEAVPVTIYIHQLLQNLINHVNN